MQSPSAQARGRGQGEPHVRPSSSRQRRIQLLLGHTAPDFVVPLRDATPTVLSAIVERLSVAQGKAAAREDPAAVDLGVQRLSLSILLALQHRLGTEFVQRAYYAVSAQLYKERAALGVIGAADVEIALTRHNAGHIALLVRDWCGLNEPMRPVPSRPAVAEDVGGRSEQGTACTALAQPAQAASPLSRSRGTVRSRGSAQSMEGTQPGHAWAAKSSPRTHGSRERGPEHAPPSPDSPQGRVTRDELDVALQQPQGARAAAAHPLRAGRPRRSASRDGYKQAAAGARARGGGGGVPSLRQRLRATYATQYAAFRKSPRGSGGWREGKASEGGPHSEGGLHLVPASDASAAPATVGERLFAYPHVERRGVGGPRLHGLDAAERREVHTRRTRSLQYGNAQSLANVRDGQMRSGSFGGSSAGGGEEATS